MQIFIFLSAKLNAFRVYFLSSKNKQAIDKKFTSTFKRKDNMNNLVYKVRLSRFCNMTNRKRNAQELRRS